MARQQLKARGDDRGSLTMALLLIVVGMMSAALLVPIVLTQIDTSRFDTRRNHAMDAARAGVDAIVGKIRDANAGDTNKVHPTGSTTKLPCTAADPLTGAVTGASNQRYQAWVYYFAQDPHGHDDWLNDKSRQITCGSTGTKYTPQYAVVYSQGTDTLGVDGEWDPHKVQTRTLQATYVFRTLNTNVPGGLIHSHKSNPDLCLDAGSSSPSPDTQVTLQRCASGTAQQLWSYNSNNTVTLASTDDIANGDFGMCLTAPYPRSLGEPIKLQTCGLGKSTIPNEQKWAYQGERPRNFLGIQANGAQEPDLDPNAPSCWSTSSVQTADANLVMGKCWQPGQDESNFDVRNVFSPDPSVGAGNASGPNGYLNNYAQFGRCMDDTYAILPQTYVIAYFCRSTPDASKRPTQAQIWNFPKVPTGAKNSSAGTISLAENATVGVTTNGPPYDRRSYCLTSPMIAGRYPSMTACNGSNNQKWVISGDTGDYTSSYRITDASGVDGTGLCLQPNPGDIGIPGTDVLKIIVTRCTGATLQKWNAPPGIVSYPITDYHER